MKQNWLTIEEKDNEVVLTKCSDEAEGEIVIPDGVTKIGESAFRDCRGLTSVTIPNSVTSIGDGAFSYCRGLTSVTIPESVTSIGDGAFSYCYELRSIVVKKGNKVYDSRENCNAIIESATNSLVVGCKNTIIPEGVTSIGDYALISNRKITIPNSITYIGFCAFSTEFPISFLDFNGSIPETNGCFRGCTINLLRVNTPRKLTDIPYDIAKALEKSDKGEVIYAAPELCQEASSVPGYIKATTAKDDELIDINAQYIMTVEPYELERYTPITGSLITMVPINKECAHRIVVYEPCSLVLKKIEEAIESLSRKLGGVSGLMDLLKFLCEKKMQ